MGEALQFVTRLEVVSDCPSCGVTFAMPSNMLSKLRENKNTFYCPNGHPQSFTESRADRLERELKQETARRERAEFLANQRLTQATNAELQVRMTRGKLRALKTRVKNGVCPCCQRSFLRLARHMRTKHPEYVAESNHEPKET